MRRVIATAATFLACMAVAALIFWISGFDFDRRGIDVAYFVLCAMAVSGIAASIAWDKTQ